MTCPSAWQADEIAFRRSTSPVKARIRHSWVGSILRISEFLKGSNRQFVRCDNVGAVAIAIKRRHGSLGLGSHICLPKCRSRRTSASSQPILMPAQPLVPRR